MVLVLLSASVERFSVSRIQDFFPSRTFLLVRKACIDKCQIYYPPQTPFPTTGCRVGTLIGPGPLQGILTNGNGPQHGPRNGNGPQNGPRNGHGPKNAIAPQHGPKSVGVPQHGLKNVGGPQQGRGGLNTGENLLSLPGKKLSL